MYTRVFLFILLSILTSCRGERWDDKLTLPRQSYYGDQLRIDGYYYNASEGRYDILLFYHDGTALYGGSPLIADVPAREIEYANGVYYNFVKDTKHNWGRFVVEGNIFKREFWPPSSGGPLDAYTHSGVILNDTTIQITKAWRSCKPRRKNDVDVIYHFKRFSPKPDSTNRFTN